ncbi:TPA: RidA family protein [Legionella pneumophila]|uniref:L-PSP (mRNA) endoribonuclease n=1 Tax=Legionella pneumophila subsp. pneumophila TaxID=91891 RepID=A0AAV2UZI8_LEGPN|nr:RidA family protein [Legionella pneumophila]MCK1849309.1 RidA family protein [Legionella pneumophila]MCZ4806830.1 RidA family protein [Legionella pneumophila]MDI9851157.1 RidA family protein [Legionella pneumophila]MDW8853457.1 RidA family protein [Legionella pneumophila]MDW8866427.1 RidA family protein [Legionella pneumophila]
MQPINTKLAPKAIGTYSQAIKSGEIVFLSGQIPLDPETMQICSDDIKLQITQVLENLSAVCEEAGGSLGNIAKLNVYLTDLSHFPLINEAMSRYFSEPYPARAAIEVSALPKGAKVEMDGILVLSASA